MLLRPTLPGPQSTPWFIPQSLPTPEASQAQLQVLQLLLQSPPPGQLLQLLSAGLADLAGLDALLQLLHLPQLLAQVLHLLGFLCGGGRVGGIGGSWRGALGALEGTGRLGCVSQRYLFKSPAQGLSLFLLLPPFLLPLQVAFGCLGEAYFATFRSGWGDGCSGLGAQAWRKFWFTLEKLHVLVFIAAGNGELELYGRRLAPPPGFHLTSFPLHPISSALQVP